MIRVVLLVTLAGCFSKPGLTPSDGPSDGSGSDSDGSGSDMAACVPSQPSPAGLVMDEDLTHQWTVRIPNGSTMLFADSGSRYPMPIAINLGPEQLVSTPSSACGREDMVGVSAFPVFTIAGNQTPTTNLHPFDRVVVGPAYIEVLSTWHHHHVPACSGGSMHGNGHTRWTFFPDGRVIRNDYILPADNGTFTMPDANCSCQGATNTFIVNSWVALAQGMVAQLTADGDSESGTGHPTMSNDIVDEPGICVRTPMGKRIGFRWERSSENRLDTRVRFFVDEYAFITDIIPLTGPGSTATMTDDVSYTTRTQLFLDNGAQSNLCTTVNSKLASHVGQAPVDINGDQTQIHGFGYFDDSQNDTRTRSSAVTLKAMYGRVEGGFTLKIRFPGYRSITTSVPATWQHEDDDTFFIFFPDGLAEQAELQITPECPT
jgi:hypothetical protein